MDDPHCDPRALAATYRRFGTVNRLVSAWGHVYRTRVRPELRALGRPARVLDLGCGGGDVVVRSRGLARRDGLDVEWVGADPDPRALDAARERSRPGVRFTAQGSRDLIAAGETFDLVLSNHVLHHLDAAELRTFAGDSLELARADRCCTPTSRAGDSPTACTRWASRPWRPGRSCGSTVCARSAAATAPPNWPPRSGRRGRCRPLPRSAFSRFARGHAAGAPAAGGGRDA